MELAVRRGRSLQVTDSHSGQLTSLCKRGCSHILAWEIVHLPVGFAGAMLLARGGVCGDARVVDGARMRLLALERCDDASQGRRVHRVADCAVAKRAELLNRWV